MDNMVQFFPPALANWGNTYARGKVIDISGSSLDELLGEISQGNPVVAYVTTYYTEPIWMNYPLDQIYITIMQLL